VLVRRLQAEPWPLAVSPGLAAPGQALGQALGRALDRSLACGPLARLHGPYPLSGGWWAEPPQGACHRDYYFAETRRGELLWLFHDRLRGQWCLQGRVE
jgi:protein ImuB